MSCRDLPALPSPRVALRLCGAAALLVASLACAGNPFTGRPEPAEKALQACIASVPPDSVGYEDRFAACMEERGWVHTAGSN